MKSLRILHISANRYPPLPASHHTAAIWRQLARGSASYHVVARAAGRGKRRVSRHGKVILHLLPSWLDRQAEILLTGWCLVPVVRKIRPDVLVAQCPVLGGLAAALASVMFRIPLFVELHGEHLFAGRGGSRLRGAFFRLLARVALYRATSIRVLSSTMLDALVGTYGHAIGRKAVVVPTRVDCSVFRQRKRDYVAQERLRVVAVGSFIPLKNHILLLEAICQLPFVELTLVGSGPMLAQYERFIEGHGLQSRVRIVPWIRQEDLSELLGTQDVFVHPSTTEALSRAILEAMAVGLPVVASNVGFMGDILHHEETALVLDGDWLESLRHCLRRLNADERLREQLGMRASRMVNSRYEAEQAFALYRQAIAASACRQ